MIRKIRTSTVVHNSCLLVLLSPLAFASDPYSAKTFPAKEIKSVSVQTESGAIALRTGDAAAVDVSPAAAPGDECRIVEELKSGVLTLIARSDARHVFGVSKGCSAGFSATLPASAKVTARSGSGAVSLGAFSGAVDARTGSGDISLDGASGELTLHSGSGALSGFAPSPRISAETGSGAVDFRGLVGIASARSGSGAVALDWDRAPASGKIVVTTGSGSLNASFPKGTKVNTDVRSAAGNIKNDFGDKGAPLSLSFKSGSGDATLTRKPQ